MRERAGDVFLEATKYQNLGPSNQQQGDEQPPLYAVLREGRHVALPNPSHIECGEMPLREAIECRRSLRTYADVAMDLEELSFLLWCTQGVKPESTTKFTLRTVPSAGARHAFETVLLVNRVEGLTPGIYQYDAACHQLIAWDSALDITQQVMAACLDQRMVETCSAVFMWVAQRERMAWRYGERGIRYLFLDAGHVCQNLYLAAESMNAGVCAIGAYNDDEVNRILQLDGTSRFVAYLAAIGKREA